MDRTYDDFDWLQQHLYSQEDAPGLQGVIVRTSFFYSSTNSINIYLVVQDFRTTYNK